MSRSGSPLVVTRASSGWCASPRQAKAHVSVLPKHEISVALGSRSCIEASEGGTPTAITSRMRPRSAAAKRGWLSTPSQIVSKAGNAIVQRSCSSWSSAAPGSKCAICSDAHSAARAPARIAMLPTWKKGSGVQKRSPGRRPSRSAIRSPSATIAECRCTQPFGCAVVPEV